MRFRPLILLALTACVSTSKSIPNAVRVEGNRLMRGDKALTEPFAGIESFDVSEPRGEVAFSAKRENNFDIGLVAIEGSPISWIPAEPVDEVGVRWAPRGNKLAYVVRGRSGDFVRVVHVSTSFQIVHDFTYAKIHTLAWDANGDNLSVTYSTPDASDRIEVMQYEGKSRKVETKPASTLDADVEPFGRGAILLRRRDIRYGETLPLVVWLDDEPLAWSDARAELMRNARVGLVVTKNAPDDDFWKNAPAWIDRSRTYVVSPRAVSVENATIVAGDASLRGSEVRRTGNVVAVSPAVVQSFAARFIADQLKRITPPNG